MKNNNNKRDVVSIFWGDSIVYGLHDKAGGWVNRLRVNLCDNKNYFFNLGIPGATAINVLNRCEQELVNRYNANDKFNLVFSVGIKDSLMLNTNEKYIVSFKNTIVKIIEIAKKYTNNIYLIGLYIPDVNIRKEYTVLNVKKIDRSLRKICKDNDVSYIKIMDKININDLSDGLHPNSIGHEKIYNVILSEIYGGK